MGIMRDISSGHSIRLLSDISRPTRLPALNLCDFFSEDTLSRRYTGIALDLLNNFKIPIRQGITAIPHEITRRVVQQLS